MKTSLEIFPPKKAEAQVKLLEAVRGLPAETLLAVSTGLGQAHAPTDFIEQLIKTHKNIMLNIAGSRIELEEAMKQLQHYKTLGINKLLILRGDQRPEEPRPEKAFGFAAELVTAIRQIFDNDFNISVAGYPEDLSDFHYLKHKVDCGADQIITQYFFDAELYPSFVTRCRDAGIQVPIIPGVMPLHDIETIGALANRQGVSVPDKTKEQYATNPEKFLDDHIKQLRDYGAPAVHVFTMNQFPLR